jgi:hypothetical protein
LPENHENSLVPDEAERISAEELFLADATSADERARIIRQFGATHALINNTNTSPELMRWLNEYAERVAIVGRYEMFRLLAE